MSARLRITHLAGCRYERPVPSAHVEARLTPLTTTGQAVLRTRLEVRPAPWQQVRSDYWGTSVTSLQVHEEHAEVLLAATSTVEVDRPPAGPPGGGWDVVRDPRVVDALAELLAPGKATQPPAGPAERARRLAASGAGPDEVALQVCRAVREHAAATAAAGSGVLAVRDLVHGVLGCLRAVGVPARYVRGYRHPHPSGPLGRPAAVEPHAWVEWWTGQWYGWDPAHDAAPGDGHVVVARAREHGDAPALTGVCAGAAAAEVVTEVEMTRLA